jgi:hypothetical protein
LPRWNYDPQVQAEELEAEVEAEEVDQIKSIVFTIAFCNYFS